MDNTITVSVQDLVGACNGARRVTEAAYECEPFVAAIGYVLNLAGYSLDFDEERNLYSATKAE